MCVGGRYMRLSINRLQELLVVLGYQGFAKSSKDRTNIEGKGCIYISGSWFKPIPIK